jgi:hypothetical protein
VDFFDDDAFPEQKNLDEIFDHPLRRSRTTYDDKDAAILMVKLWARDCYEMHRGRRAE